MQDSLTIYRLGKLASMLSGAVGDEQAEALIRETARDLGLNEQLFSEADARRILSELATREGPIGLTAALAKSRLHFSRAGRRLKR